MLQSRTQCSGLQFFYPPAYPMLPWTWFSESVLASPAAPVNVYNGEHSVLSFYTKPSNNFILNHRVILYRTIECFYIEPFHPSPPSIRRQGHWCQSITVWGHLRQSYIPHPYRPLRLIQRLTTSPHIGFLLPIVAIQPLIQASFSCP